MKVLTSAQMREVDRRTIALGIPESVLMENAGRRVVEFLEDRFSPLSSHRVAVLCGKGNNGGDGRVIARLLTGRVAALYVVHSENASDRITGEMRSATLVIDALLGTGIAGVARSRVLELIHEINTGFPRAQVVAVDIPSGMASDSGTSEGEVARAGYTVTFTAPKIAHVMPPNCDLVGDLRIADIGSPPELYADVTLHLSQPADFHQLLQPRPKDSNKGMYGHVLVIGGAPGKTGAAEMTGLAALRAGAGLVTVASSADRLATLELMTARFPPEDLARYSLLAIGPGLGSEPASIELARTLVTSSEQPLVADADALNALAGFDWHSGGRFRVLTPHPGEMSRLAGISIRDVQKDRLAVALHYAKVHGAVVVLKGHRSVIALPDGRAWINPTGSPAMATAGTGDILTGLIAGLTAQFPAARLEAVIAGVYLHGLAGEIGAAALGEKCLIATDLLHHLPEAMHVCSEVSH
ncbi:MAG TPA: NAD(P)H-hydrate dehydratase [Bryobacteraceae bacterium]|nr:NAD(P)H-hydrate dehydratase [Bryobacteraceae bacterium]